MKCSIPRKRLAIFLSAGIVALSILLTACGENRPQVTLVPDAKSISPAPSTPVNSPVPTPSATTVPEPTLTSAISPGTGRPVLEWQGLISAGDNDPPGCKSFLILALPVENSPGQMGLGPCGTQLKSMEINRPELVEMVNRLAPFELKSQQDYLVFRGKGQMDSPAWHRAVLAWVQSSYLEAATGHACSACRTALSWYLGPVEGKEGSCRHLTVLNFGYAYAGVVPCSGGNSESATGGWIEASAWEQFDEWLYGRARFDKDNSYFDGKGPRPMSTDELSHLEDWAAGVYGQLTENR